MLLDITYKRHVLAVKQTAQKALVVNLKFYHIKMIIVGTLQSTKTVHYGQCTTILLIQDFRHFDDYSNSSKCYKQQTTTIRKFLIYFHMHILIILEKYVCRLTWELPWLGTNSSPIEPILSYCLIQKYWTN